MAQPSRNLIRLCVHAGFDDQIVAVSNRTEITCGGAPAPPPVGCGLIISNSLLPSAVEIPICRDACLNASGDDSISERVGFLMIRNLQRTATAMKPVRAALLILGFPKVRQHIIEAPSDAPELASVVIVSRMSADINAAIDRTRPAENLAARLISSAAIEFRQRFAIEHPVDPGVCKEHRVPERRAYPEARVFASCLEQQNFVFADSLRRAARTQPADPAPTTTKSYSPASFMDST